MGLSEGLMVAAVPAAGYWFAYLYELGFCRYFDLPASFVDIGIPTVFGAVVAATGAAVFLLLFGEIPLSIYRSLPSPIRKPIRLVSPLIVMTVGFGLVYRWTLSQSMWAFGVVVLPICMYHFVWPLFSQRTVQGYAGKLAAHNRSDEQGTTTMDIVAHRIGGSWFGALFLLYLLSVAFFFIGGYEAKSQKEFIVLLGVRQSVVLKFHKDFAVVATYVDSTKLISSEFRLVPVGDRLGRFRVLKIGPLKPAPQSQ